MRLPSFIRAIVGCTDTETSRYALAGVKVEHRSNVSVLTATDGRQLVSVSYADESPGSQPVDAIVDGKSLAKAFGGVHKAKTPASLSIGSVPDGEGSKAVAFLSNKSGDTQIAQLIDGRFPRWRDVFNAEGEYSISLSPGLLRQLLAIYESAGCDAVRFWVKDRQSGVHMAGKAPTGEVIRSVLMPMATDDPSTSSFGDTQNYPCGYDMPVEVPCTVAMPAQEVA